jgi:hypothetical protein
MAMGVPHYLKDGTPHGSGGMGAYHKMKDGTLHSGKTHTKSSKKLFHYNELSKTAKDKAKKNHDAFLKKKKKDGKRPQSRNRKKT